MLVSSTQCLCTFLWTNNLLLHQQQTLQKTSHIPVIKICVTTKLIRELGVFILFLCINTLGISFVTVISSYCITHLSGGRPTEQWVICVCLCFHWYSWFYVCVSESSARGTSRVVLSCRAPPVAVCDCGDVHVSDAVHMPVHALSSAGCSPPQTWPTPE